MGGSPLTASLTASANLLVGRFVTVTPPRLVDHDGVAAAALCGHGLRRDVGARRAHRRGQPRAGLSRRRRPGCDVEDRRERDRRWRQPVPARAGHRATAGGHRRTAQAPLRHGVRPGHRGAGHRRRHRGHRRSGARVGRAGLGSIADRAVLRLLLPRHRDGRLPAPRRAAGARRPRLRHRCRRAAPRGDPAHQGVDPQLAAQPDRDGRDPTPSWRRSPTSP